MNILIDAHYLDKKKEGNRTFVLSLLKGFKKMKKEIGDIKFYLPVYKKSYWEKRLRNDNFFWLNCSTLSLKRYLYDFPMIIRKYKIDLIQNTYFFPPFVSKNLKKVLIIHDVFPFSRPELFNIGFRLRFKVILKLSVRKASKIICGSNFTKNEIVKQLKVLEEKIETIYYGIDIETKTINDELDKEYLFMLNIENPFALFVGRLDKRKNLFFLLDIIDKLYDKLNLKLVIVGRKENVNKNVVNRIKDMSIQKKVYYTGQIPDKELDFLYKKADVLLYFPEIEGFGYPIIEAMKFDLPFLTVNRGAIKEIAIDGSFINLNNKEEAIKKISKLIVENNLREKFIKKSRKRVKAFSDVIMASKILNLYKDIL